MALTLLDMLRGADDQVALVEPASGDRTTYGALRDAVDRIGRELVGLGMAPGDVVALTGGNGPEIVLAFLAVVAAGGAAAPLNPAYTADEFRAYLDDLRPRAMLFVGDARRRARGVHASGDLRDRPRGRRGRATEHSRRPCGAGAAGRRARRGRAAAAHERHDEQAEDRAAAPAQPRGVGGRDRGSLRAHRRRRQPLRDAAVPRPRAGRLDARDASRPAARCSCRAASAPARSGTTRRARRDVVLGGADDPSGWLARAETAPGDTPLRFARSCSSPLPASLWQTFEERFGIPLVEAYGMTEAAHQMASNPLPPGERRPGSVGIATGVEVAVLDDDWRTLRPGAVGEVAVRGRAVVDGYRDNPEANAAVLPRRLVPHRRQRHARRRRLSDAPGPASRS